MKLDLRVDRHRKTPMSSCAATSSAGKPIRKYAPSSSNSCRVAPIRPAPVPTRPDSGSSATRRADRARKESGAVRRTTGALRARRLRRARLNAISFTPFDRFAQLRSQPVPDVPPLWSFQVLQPEYGGRFQTFQCFAPFKFFKPLEEPKAKKKQFERRGAFEGIAPQVEQAGAT